MRARCEHDGRKVGIFGGTFNPIHYGHLRSAEEVREAFCLDKIYFVPSANPPHKSDRTLASAVHRLRMVELAVADNPCFSASAVEVERSGLSYSVDTIRQFVVDFPTSSLFFLIGLDAVHEIHTWKEYDSLPTLCNFIVTSRPGVPTPPGEDWLPVALRQTLWYDSVANIYRHASGHSIALYDIQGLNISASQVRRTASQGKSVRYLVPPAVQEYIRNNTLYQQEETIR